MNIEHEAKRRLAMILARIADADCKPDLIPLTDYADEATYSFLLPNPGWSFLEWQSVNDEVANRLRGHGYNVRLVKVELSEYFDFLAQHDLTNTTATRAQFAAWKVLVKENPDAPK